MAQNSIEKMLEINTKIEKGGVTPSVGASKGQRIHNQQELDRLIENYDRMAYGSSTESVSTQSNQNKYDARAEMERLKENYSTGELPAVNLEGKNIPQGILESILNNPLVLKPIDPRMDVLEEKIRDKMPGIVAAKKIFEKTEKQEKEARAKLNEQLNPRQNTTSGVDYEIIKMLIENAIDKKIEDLKQTINESSARQQTYIPSIKYLNFKDKFYFVDNENNVFECVMKYCGKKK